MVTIKMPRNKLVKRARHTHTHTHTRTHTHMHTHTTMLLRNVEENKNGKLYPVLGW